MAKTFLISTTGAGTTTIDDLGGRAFLHPIVSLDLTEEYTLEEIRDSDDLKAAIVAGDLTAVFDTAAITDATTFDNHLVDFDRVQTITNTTDISNNAAAIALLQDGGGRLGEVLDYVDNTAVPPTEVLGDRYILDDTGASNAAWDGAAALDLVEFDGAVWVVKAVESGNETFVAAESQDRMFVDDGSPAWEARPTSITQTAVQVPYTPTTAADWDVVPTEVGGALDEAASRIEDLENATPPASKKTYTYSAGDDGNLNGSRDLRRTGSVTTNITPFIVPITGTIWGITVASKQGVNLTYNVEIYVNGSSVHTENVVAADKSFDNALALAVTAGDEVRIRFTKLAANVADLGVEVYGIEA
jgi:hypothetical protein